MTNKQMVIVVAVLISLVTLGSIYFKHTHINDNTTMEIING
ncbi:hypothetical protein [Vibrio phage VCPH]|nr:hypothetical protein [Vibrio phage VCPH]